MLSSGEGKGMLAPRDLVSLSSKAARGNAFLSSAAVALRFGREEEVIF
jgi:hypothetical protein